MCASQVSAVLSALEGPFACVVWDPVRKEIWFARDALGRRSLVAAWSGSTLVVASVSCEGLGWCGILSVLLMILKLVIGQVRDPSRTLLSRYRGTYLPICPTVMIAVMTAVMIAVIGAGWLV